MIIFSVGGFTFGVEVDQIISIEASSGKTEQMDESVSFVDLSKQFTKGPTNDGGASVALLVDTGGDITGVYVDSVKSVVNMPLEQIEPLPEFLRDRVRTDCIWGIAKLGQELVVLLDIARYLPCIKHKVASMGGST